MAKRRRKYPKRPWSDGDHWVAGAFHQRGRQSRGQPIENPLPMSDVKSAGLMTMGPNHVTDWRLISRSTMIELMLRMVLTPEQVRGTIRRLGITKRGVLATLGDTLTRGLADGTIPDPMAVLRKYGKCLTT